MVYEALTKATSSPTNLLVAIEEQSQKTLKESVVLVDAWSFRSIRTIRTRKLRRNGQQQTIG